MSVVGILGLVSKLHKWNESAVFFDGTSLGVFLLIELISLSYGCLETAAYVFGIIVYLSVTVPSLRAIAEPTTDSEIYDDQVMALRVLSAGNIIIIGSLLLILALQVRGFRKILGLTFDSVVVTGWTRMGTSARSQYSC
jgi:hypothetical protein